MKEMVRVYTLSSMEDSGPKNIHSFRVRPAEVVRMVPRYNKIFIKHVSKKLLLSFRHGKFSFNTN